MEKSKILLILLIASALLVFGCAGYGSSGKGAASQQADTAKVIGQDIQQIPPASVMASQNEQFGSILTDAKGMALYVFTKDEMGKSNCYGKCAQLWPPLVSTDGKAGGSLPGLIGIITRTDGSMQVTYNGMPLYYWASDKSPGDTTGQGVGGVWYVAQPNMTGFPGTASLDGGFNTNGNVLISDQYNNRVIEVNPKTDKIVWSFGSDNANLCNPGPGTIIGPNWAERLSNGLTLIAGTGIPSCPDNRVIVVNQAGGIVWQYGQANVTGSGTNELNVPVAAIELPNGNYLITDQGNNRIIEVNGQGQIVWSYGPTSGPGALNSPNSAALLDNGNILIADENNNRSFEITRSGDMVWQYGMGIQAAAFASRLPNGNTLIVDSGNSRILVVSTDKQIVSQYYTNSSTDSNSAPFPTNAVMLKDGNMIIADEMNHRVFTIDAQDKIVWQYGTTNVSGNESGFLNGPYTGFAIGDYTGQTMPPQ